MPYKNNLMFHNQRGITRCLSKIYQLAYLYLLNTENKLSMMNSLLHPVKRSQADYA